MWCPLFRLNDHFSTRRTTYWCSMPNIHVEWWLLSAGYCSLLIFITSCLQRGGSTGMHKSAQNPVGGPAVRQRGICWDIFLRPHSDWPCLIVYIRSYDTHFNAILFQFELFRIQYLSTLRLGLSYTMLVSRLWYTLNDIFFQFVEGFLWGYISLPMLKLPRSYRIMVSGLWTHLIIPTGAVRIQFSTHICTFRLQNLQTIPQLVLSKGIVVQSLW